MPRPPDKRSISLLTATCLVVANMVGTGVFTSLGFQVGALPSGFAILCLWLLGGVCAFCGAVAYGELAAAFPRSGGEYHYLSKVYHPAVGFLAGWLSASVGFAAPVALAAMAFGKYFGSMFPGIAPLGPSLLVVGMVTAIHLRGGGFSSIFQNAATSFKLLLILGLIAAGISAGQTQPISFLFQTSDVPLLTSAPFAVSLFYVMYSYSGWNASTYIVGEIENPARNVPRSVGIGTLLVIGLYLALNAIFLRVAPISELTNNLEVGQIAAAHIFGPTGGKIMAGLICVGLISSISAMTWVGPRVTMTMGEDCRALSIFARKTASGIPVIAIVGQSLIVSLLLATASFNQILIYVQFSLQFCSFLAVLGVIILRFTQPTLPRPYKTWGYPVTPLIFLAVSSWMLWQIAQSNPKESLVGLGTMLLGLIIYFFSPTQEAERSR